MAQQALNHDLNSAARARMVSRVNSWMAKSCHDACGTAACRLQKPTVAADSADAPLRYTSRSVGNCLDFSFPRQPRTTQTPSASPGAPPTQAPKRCAHSQEKEKFYCSVSCQRPECKRPAPRPGLGACRRPSGAPSHF